MGAGREGSNCLRRIGSHTARIPCLEIIKSLFKERQLVA